MGDGALATDFQTVHKFCMSKQTPKPNDYSLATQPGAPGPLNHICDVPGIHVGHAHDPGVRSGVSVIVPDQPMVCAVDVRGGGPGTRETDLLDPATLVQTVDALVLSGGSTYGLAAADGVTAHLGASGRGFALVARDAVPRSPIVPGAILYDLANGGDKGWGLNPPYHDLGVRAFGEAMRRGAPALDTGRIGAGFGAIAGQVAGGLGSVSATDADGLCVGALMAVNSFGSVFMPGSDVFWAWPFEQNNEFGGKKPGMDGTAAIAGLPDDTKLGPRSGAPARAAPHENTTIGVVALSAPMTQAEAKRIAIMAQDGLARAIRPVHAPTDGDVLFVLAPAPEPGAPGLDLVTQTKLGTMAADCVARAIARGVFEANKVQ